MMSVKINGHDIKIVLRNNLESDRPNLDIGNGDDIEEYLSIPIKSQHHNRLLDRYEMSGCLLVIYEVSRRRTQP